MGTSAVAASFSADLVQQAPGQTLRGKVYVRGEAYRMELEDEKGEPVVVLVDQEAGLTLVLLPSEKAYLELENTSPRSLMNNPFQSYRFSASRYETRDRGRETVNGYDCSRLLVRSEGGDIMTAWVADELGFPVKIVNHLSEGRYAELRNIQKKDLEDALFHPPEEYTRMTRMPVPAPEWFGDLARAPRVEAPFEKTLAAGGIVRVPLKPGFKVKVHGKSVSDGNAALTAVAFKEGRPVKDPSMGTFNLQRKGQGVTLSPRETSTEADEVVVRVREGEVHVAVEPVEAPAGLVLQKAHVKNMSGKELHAEAGKPLRMTLRDDPEDGIPTRGQLIWYRGRAQYKQELRQGALQMKDGESRTWRFEADEGIETISLSVLDGGVHVRLEQPEKPGLVPPSWQGQAPSSPTKSADAEAGPRPDVEGKVSAAGDTGRAAIVFILDASGSMWGQVEGTAKIAIAKEVMTELIRDLPGSADAGLVAYGHRRKGDCSDVEELVALQPVDKAALTERIQGISPKGKTPITLSVQKTAEKLRTVEDETIIILVSDGKETCEGDPCALVEELKKAGVRFTLHVIGFDVTEEERVQLECMARAGGGEYFTAKTAQEFRVAAKRAVEKAPSVGYLRVTALRNGTPFNAHVEVYPREGKDVLKSGRTGTGAGRPGARLQPGVYDLQVTDPDTPNQAPVRLEGIQIEAGKTTEREVSFVSGVLKLTVLKQGEPSNAGVRVLEAGTGNLVADRDTSAENPLTQHLLPGGYEVVVRDDRVQPPQEIRFSDLTLAAGEMVEKTADFSGGGLSVEVLVNGEKDAAGLYVFEAGTGNRVTTADTSRDNPCLLELEPGAYDLQVVYRKSKPESEIRFDGIEVQAGQVVEKRAVFGHGGLSVEVLVNGEKGSAGLYIFQAGTRNRVTTGDTSRDNPKIFELNAGAYDLKVVYRKATPETEQVFKDIRIVAGETVEQQAGFEEGILEIRTTSGGRPLKANYSLFHPGEKKRFDSEYTNRKIQMRPGSYEALVRAYTLEGKPEKRVAFAIQSGQTTTVNVDF
jgi:Ca-activated chloride channel family protein